MTSSTSILTESALGPEPARVAEIVATGQDNATRFSFGSGYLIGPARILTAFHVVSGANAKGALEVRLLGAPDRWQPARMVWADPTLDVALLQLDYPGGDLARCGRLPRGSAADCVAIGFPAAVAFERTRETEGIEGWVKPFSGLKEGVLHIEVRGANPGDVASWSGASGAALFSAGFLIGVIVRVPRAFRGGRVKAIPLERFSRALAAAGLGVPDPLPVVPHPDRAAMAFRAAWDVGDPVAWVLKEAGRFVVAREDELAALNHHVATGAPEPLVVTAPAGHGKTALLAHWLDTLGEERAVAAHVFSGASELTSVADAHRHLLAQIRLAATGAAALPGEPLPSPRVIGGAAFGGARLAEHRRSAARYRC
jgi:hypothetical protein